MRTITMIAAALAAIGSVSIAQASSLGRPCTTAPQVGGIGTQAAPAANAHQHH